MADDFFAFSITTSPKRSATTRRHRLTVWLGVVCWACCAPSSAHPGHDHTFAEHSPTEPVAAATGAFGPPLRPPSTERILYVRGEFADTPIGIPDSLFLSRAQTIDATAEDFWNFNSYGRIQDFDSDFTELLSLSTNAADLPRTASGSVNVFAIRDVLVDAAQQAGHNVASYDQVVLLFPSIPGFPAGALGTPGTVWLPGSNPFDGGLIHELGHAFGLGHASALEAGTQSLTSQQPSGLFGEHREGRDGLFMLGSEGGVVLNGPDVDGRRAPINLAQRYQAGFVETELINRVDQSGVFRIHAFDRADISGDRALDRSLAVAFDFGGQEWWLSFAPGLADLWANFNGEGFAEGAILHQVEGSITRIVDFTPGSQGGVGTNGEDFVDTRDGALVAGESFTFPDSDLTITTIGSGVSADGVPYLDVRLLVSEVFGDINGDDEIGLDDFDILAANLFSDIAATDPTASLAFGDLNGDLQVDFSDFVDFRDAFNEANGAGALAAALDALSIPEPSCCCLATLLVLAIQTSCRAKRIGLSR